MKLWKKYKITVEDESHLTEVASGRFSRPALWGICLLFLIICMVISGVIIAVTPIRTLLPGYLKETQRSATEESLMRLDSLTQAYEVNRSFINNFFRVTDIDRMPSDSASLTPTSRELTSDSLMTATNQEQRFVNQMEERERFNISVLAPLAADGVTFSPVTPSGVFTASSKESQEAEIIMVADENVQCSADGAVIAVYHLGHGQGYYIAVQHNRGFVTTYSGVGTPLVGVGDNVNA